MGGVIAVVALVIAVRVWGREGAEVLSWLAGIISAVGTVVTVVSTVPAAAPGETAGPVQPAGGLGRRRLVAGAVMVAVLLVAVGAVSWWQGWLPPAQDSAQVKQSASASPNVLPSITASASAGPSVSSSPSTSPLASPTADSNGPRPVTTSAVPAAPQPEDQPEQAPQDDAEACQAASNAGSLDIGPALNNSGGPNTVPPPCTSIWLTLTEVRYITYARACLEDAEGVDIRCGDRVYLRDGGAWNLLLDGVAPGDRWQLYLEAQGEGRVGFNFSG